MIDVSVHEAKTHLSRLLTRVASGEEVVISRYGRAVAKLVPVESPRPKREGGADRGLLTIPDDFTDEMEEIIRVFEQ